MQSTYKNSLLPEGMGTYMAIKLKRSKTSASFTFEIVREGRRSNVDAHNLARSCVFESVSRLVCLTPPKGVCKYYSEQSIKVRRWWFFFKKKKVPFAGFDREPRHFPHVFMNLSNEGSSPQY
jgi:hypothetical protein